MCDDSEGTGGVGGGYIYIGGIRQISSYLPEPIRQISSYLPDPIRQITSSFHLSFTHQLQIIYIFVCNIFNIGSSLRYESMILFVDYTSITYYLHIHM